MMLHKPILILVLTLGACSLTKRAPQTYRADTQKVLETRNAQIQSCYEEALKSDATASATMTVQFVVKKKTGTFTNATLDPEKSKAPEPLVLCVMKAIDGLKLEPPDANEGHATFIYELKPSLPSS